MIITSNDKTYTVGGAIAGALVSVIFVMTKDVKTGGAIGAVIMGLVIGGAAGYGVSKIANK